MRPSPPAFSLSRVKTHMWSGCPRPNRKPPTKIFRLQPLGQKKSRPQGFGIPHNTRNRNMKSLKRLRIERRGNAGGHGAGTSVRPRIFLFSVVVALVGWTVFSSSRQTFAVHDKLSMLYRDVDMQFPTIATGLSSLLEYDSATNDVEESDKKNKSSSVIRSTTIRVPALKYEYDRNKNDGDNLEKELVTMYPPDVFQKSFDKPNQTKPHPFAGARYPNGTWGYIADTTMVQNYILKRYYREQNQQQRERFNINGQNNSSVLSSPSPPPPPRSYLYFDPTRDELNAICNTPLGQGIEGNSGGWALLTDRVQLEGPHPTEQEYILEQQQQHEQSQDEYGQENGGKNSTFKKSPYNKTKDTWSDRTYYEPSKGKILCAIYTHKGAHEYRLAGIRDTWGWRCDGFIAISTVTYDATRSTTKGGNNDHDNVDVVHLGAVDLPHLGEEKYGNMWQKTRSILGYLYENYLNDFDYFYVCGDDTLLVVENLRRYLGYLEVEEGFSNATKALYMGDRSGGFHLKFVGGGSGYVLNRETLRRFVTGNLVTCQHDKELSSEDREVGACLRLVGIRLTATEDPTGRIRFVGVGPDWAARDKHMPATIDLLHMYYPEEKYRHVGSDLVSSQTIAFHILKGHVQMKRIFAIIYKSCPVGTVLGDVFGGPRKWMLEWI